jgi:hypothetical protein
MGNSDQHRQIVKQLLDSKAVDFTAIGKVVVEAGPSLSIAEEPVNLFCGVNCIFIRVYRVTDPGTPVENLGELAGSTGVLQG